MMSEQLGLLAPEIVNVASVPQRSPFRYAGGKTWLVPVLRRWLGSRARPSEFLEPFVGGGIISLTVAMEDRADHVTMVELDEDVGAVWMAILEGDATWLARRITAFTLTPEHAREVLSRTPKDTREHAFQTILKNRIQRGGILAKGAGWIKFGEGGKGIASRWYPETLASRIKEIAQVRDRISFVPGDGLAAMRRIEDRADALCFIDPPYTAGKGKRAGSRLYTHNQIDHEELFCIARRLRGDFLMTYDNAPDVVAMAERHGFTTRLVPMKSTHHAEMTELLISRNLDWLPDNRAAGVAVSEDRATVQ